MAFLKKWSELNELEKPSIVVPIAGLIGGWGILFLGRPMIGCAVIWSTVMVEIFLLWMNRKKGGEKDV